MLTQMQRTLFGSKRVQSILEQGEGHIATGSCLQQLRHTEATQAGRLQWSLLASFEHTQAGCSSHIGAMLAAGGDEGLDDAGIDLHNK